MKDWQKDAKNSSDYHCCETKRGREFIIRLTTGADPVKAIARFAEEQGVRYGKVHAPFMGAFRKTRYLMWVPNTKNAQEWHCETVAESNSLSSICALGGMIGVRPTREGGEESFVAMHFVVGASWDSAVFGGHLEEGTEVAGTFQVFVTELLDIEALKPDDLYDEEFTWPQNWYKNIKEEIYAEK